MFWIGVNVWHWRGTMAAPVFPARAPAEKHSTDLLEL
jgi:hypothetical protein